MPACFSALAHTPLAHALSVLIVVVRPGAALEFPVVAPCAVRGATGRIFGSRMALYGCSAGAQRDADRFQPATVTTGAAAAVDVTGV